MQLQALNRLLAQAKRRVPYYRRSDAFPAALGSLKELQTLPILRKADIRVHGTDLLTEDSDEQIWWKSTGGSTGEPLHFAHSPVSHAWRTAMSLRGYSWAGAPPGSKQAYIWGVATTAPGTVAGFKEALHRRIERKRLYNCFSFTPDAMRECYAALRRWRPEVLVGYTNPTYEFARFIQREGLEPLPVRSVLCAAEKVHPAQRETIASVFQCDVFDTYGSREFMLIGSECPEHRGLHVSMENLIVEVVDDDGDPVRAGETGRLLVTDLHNAAMPFIRYEIGDLARASDDRCPCGRGLQLLDDIVGRSLDVIRAPGGRVIPGELFPHLMKDYPEILRFQVVQERPDSIRLLLQAENTVSADLGDAIRSKVNELVGEPLAIDIEPVDAIPLTPSGKHRVTVSRIGG